MMFVSLVKVCDSLGLMGVETGNDNLGGLAGTCALVTVMDVITSFPLVVSDRAQIHWPIVLPYMAATFTTVPLGISILALTVSTQDETLPLKLKRAFGALILGFVLLQFAMAWHRHKRATAIYATLHSPPPEIHMCDKHVSHTHVCQSMHPTSFVAGEQDTAGLLPAEDTVAAQQTPTHTDTPAHPTHEIYVHSRLEQHTPTERETERVTDREIDIEKEKGRERAREREREIESHLTLDLCVRQEENSRTREREREREKGGGGGEAHADIEACPPILMTFVDSLCLHPPLPTNPAVLPLPPLAEAAAAASLHGDFLAFSQQRDTEAFYTRLEKNLPGRWRPWRQIVVVTSGVAGAAAGALSGLFGAGAPPALVLFAYFASRPDLALHPAVLRASGQANYFGNVFIRACFLASRNFLFFDRWWRYYCICIAAGAVGVLAGSRLYRMQKPDPIKYQKIMQALLFSCGVFFLFTPS